jgi:hypothetical protein
MGRHGATQFSGAYWDFIQHGGQMRQPQTAWQARTVLLWEEGGGHPGGITERPIRTGCRICPAMASHNYDWQGLTSAVKREGSYRVWQLHKAMYHTPLYKIINTKKAGLLIGYGLFNTERSWSHQNCLEAVCTNSSTDQQLCKG